MNLAGISVALGIAVMFVLSLPYSLMAAVPLGIWLIAKSKR